MDFCWKKQNYSKRLCKVEDSEYTIEWMLKNVIWDVSQWSKLQKVLLGVIVGYKLKLIIQRDEVI